MTVRLLGQARMLFLAEVFVYGPLAPPPPPSALEGAAAPPPAFARRVDDVNRRFTEGRPSDSLADAGVVIHMFDDFEDWDGGRPWMVCSSLRCRGEVDHLSASLINRRVPHLYQVPGGGAGVVVSPTVRLACSYAYDSGTQGKVNGGCGAVPCTTHPAAWECSWPPDHLKQMMQAQEGRGSAYDGHSAGGSLHNELIISDIYWEQDLPRLIYAFVFTADAAEAKAREAHAAFLAYYGQSEAQTPLLRFTGSGFVDVSGGGASEARP